MPAASARIHRQERCEIILHVPVDLGVPNKCLDVLQRICATHETRRFSLIRMAVVELEKEKAAAFQDNGTDTPNVDAP